MKSLTLLVSMFALAFAVGCGVGAEGQQAEVSAAPEETASTEQALGCVTGSVRYTTTGVCCPRGGAQQKKYVCGDAQWYFVGYVCKGTAC